MDVYESIQSTQMCHLKDWATRSSEGENMQGNSKIYTFQRTNDGLLEDLLFVQHVDLHFKHSLVSSNLTDWYWTNRLSNLENGWWYRRAGKQNLQHIFFVNQSKRYFLRVLFSQCEDSYLCFQVVYLKSRVYFFTVLLLPCPDRTFTEFNAPFLGESCYNVLVSWL